jgi:hypothetical protein
MIRTGVRLPWRRVPRACSRRQKDLTEEEELFLDKEVARMLEMDAVYETQETDGVTSSIYTVPKRDSDRRRPVNNLRWVNSHLPRIKFKMSTIKDVKAAITRDCFMTSIDLSDCFWGVPVCKRDQKFLAFTWRGKTYRFRCLPFGLSLSPMFITKIYKHVVERLQLQGHKVVLYIDDMLILGRDKAACEAATRAAIDLFKDLGAVVNFAKSSITPAQEIEYLGFTLNSKTMMITAPKKKLANLTKAIRQVINKRDRCTPRMLASVLGKINSLADALFPTRVHTTGLETQKLRALRASGWDTATRISDEALEDLQWWKDNVYSMNGRSLIPPTVDIQSGTDASDYGWGAWMETPKGVVRWGGYFTRKEQAHHINYKELLAVHYMLLGPPDKEALRHKVLGLGIDNTTAMWYLRKMGGRNSKLAKLATLIYGTTATLQMNLNVFHVPGVMNQVADEESRKDVLRLTDSAISQNLFTRLEETWGPFSMDLFATFQDKMMDRFASMSPQPQATWVDAMSHNWSQEYPWANPPFALLGRILQKVENEGATMVIAAPIWPAAPWFPRLLDLMTEPPILVPKDLDQRHHPLSDKPMTPSWVSAVWKISGDACVRGKSRRQLSRQFYKRGPRQLTSRMTPFGSHGLTSLKAKARIQQLKTAISLTTGWPSE